ncbi:hypothetical protein C0991_000562, partial [Blastosporella zonata]
WDRNPSLSKALLTTITESALYKNGLFPPPGSNPLTKNGGGLTKVEFQWMVAQDLFSKYDEFEDALALAIIAVKPENQKTRAGKTLAGKYQGQWADKIKNCLTKMRKITLNVIGQMGLSGMGITAEEQLLAKGSDEMINKW